MESLSKQELISTIAKQSDHMKRYEGRLRDVVTAYKGLVKEKDALEISLKALNKTENTPEGDDSVAALTLSLSTLTAEKARMEEAFQADKKVTRDKNNSRRMFQNNKAMDQLEVACLLKLIQNMPITTSKETNASTNKKKEEAWVKLTSLFNAECGTRRHKDQLKSKWDNLKKAVRKRQIQLNNHKYENMLAAMRDETRSLVQQHLAEINNYKAKIAYEIQEREKERADHAAMIKELHLKLNSEMKKKEKLEDNATHSTESQACQADLEKRVRDLSLSLEASQRQVARADARAAHTPALLVQLQGKLAAVEQAHAVAIREEQIKAKRTEEQARKACARQEERVAILEGKLAELSQTVGQYDLRRRRDQKLIEKLKDALNGKIISGIASDRHDLEEELLDPPQRSETDNEKLADSEYLKTLIDKIHILKKEFIFENEKLGSPIDVTTIFNVENYDFIHLKCKDELERLRTEFETYKIQNALASSGDDKTELESLRTEIFVLKDKVETYKLMLDEEKQDKIDTLKLYEEKLKNEEEYHKEITSDLKTRVQSLEKQVVTQRDRYALLLEETDKYIRGRSERARRLSAEQGGWASAHGLFNDARAPPHMLHYAHELARKDLDISQLRREKHGLEGQLRDCQRDATIEKERFKEVVRTLKEEIDRLRRTQSREGANLEYLKNVVISYLMSADYAGRRHMLNAIAAVLHFTTAETNMVLSTL